ncbi:DMT family transporter [Bacillus sp. FJAT-27245]|uniref:DMT family transporter n=1 Tax=Bacillus sp. FJAT-27245 TaxID=1684144 RepID=UPI0006A7A4E9|nr:multidrug efflux SMR transporter [Bacillus sp. FJAT-27245]
MSHLFLMLAIILELIGSSLLKASEGFSKLYPTLGVIVAFVSCFFFLSLSLKTMPLNTAYAIWSGIGIIATTIISVIIWKEKINLASITGIALIVVGVVILNLFGPGHDESSSKANKSSEVLTENND